MTVIAGPFGLFGFGLATILLNLTNCGFFPLNSNNLAMGFALGFGLQGVGALIALSQQQLLASVAFFGYAFFWLSYVLTFMMQPHPLAMPNELAVGCYLMVWLLFSIGMTACIWRPKSTWAIRITFITVDLLFLLLAVMEFLKYNEHDSVASIVKKVAGGDGIFCGFCALYTGMAEVMNSVYQTTILPLGEINAPGKPSRPLIDAASGDDDGMPRTTSLYEVHESHYTRQRSKSKTSVPQSLEMK